MSGIYISPKLHITDENVKSVKFTLSVISPVDLRKWYECKPANGMFDEAVKEEIYGRFIRENHFDDSGFKTFSDLGWTYDNMLSNLENLFNLGK